MPRSHWKGMIAFGLVSIPVELHAAINKKAAITFHQIDKKNHARIKYQRINADTGKVVPWEQIIKGYEYDKDKIIPVPDNVLQRVAGDNGRMIDIDSFVDRASFDFRYIENCYYLVPDKKGEKGYVILREALKESHKVGIAKVIISTKEYLAAVVPFEQALILFLLHYYTELHQLDDYDLPSASLKSYKIQKKEIDIAKQLINSMASKWQPEKFKDDYQLALQKWAHETVKRIPHTKAKSSPKPATTTVNFMDLLRKSLQSENYSKKSARTKTRAHPRSFTKAKSSGKHAIKH